MTGALPSVAKRMFGHRLTTFQGPGRSGCLLDKLTYPVRLRRGAPHLTSPDFVADQHDVPLQEADALLKRAKVDISQRDAIAHHAVARVEADKSVVRQHRGDSGSILRDGDGLDGAAERPFPAERCRRERPQVHSSGGVPTHDYSAKARLGQRRHRSGICPWERLLTGISGI